VAHTTAEAAPPCGGHAVMHAVEMSILGARKPHWGKVDDDNGENPFML